MATRARGKALTSSTTKRGRSATAKSKSPKPARRNRAPREPERSPLAMLDAIGAGARPQIAAHGDHVALCVGSAVKLYHRDTPLRDVQLDPLVAVACTRSRFAGVDARGVLHVFDAAGTTIASRPVGKAPRSLYATPDEHFLVLVEDGLVFCDADGAPMHGTEFPRPLAAAAHADGTIVVVGEDHRLAEWTGTELVDIPPTAEQIVAIASLGRRGRFVCVGQRHWFLLDLADRELEALAQASESHHVAASRGGRIAWTTAAREVLVGTLDGRALVAEHRVTYPATYGHARDVLGMFTAIDPTDEPLAVTGLAFLDREHLAIALLGGRGNLIDLRTTPATAARKLDEHPGDPHASWEFEYQGQRLIAR